MHAAYGNGMPMTGSAQLQQQPLQTGPQQQQQQQSSNLKSSGAGSPSNAGGYTSYFGTDNVMCRPVH